MLRQEPPLARQESSASWSIWHSLMSRQVLASVSLKWYPSGQAHLIPPFRLMHSCEQPPFSLTHSSMSDTNPYKLVCFFNCYFFFNFWKLVGNEQITFACFLIVAEFITGRTLTLGAAGQIVAIMRTAEIGQLFVWTFVHVGARLVTFDQRVAGRANAVGRPWGIDAVVGASKIIGYALVDIWN